MGGSPLGVDMRVVMVGSAAGEVHIDRSGSSCQQRTPPDDHGGNVFVFVAVGRRRRQLQNRHQVHRSCCSHCGTVSPAHQARLIPQPRRCHCRMTTTSPTIMATATTLTTVIATAVSVSWSMSPPDRDVLLAVLLAVLLVWVSTIAAA